MKKNPFRKSQLSAEYQALIGEINLLRDKFKTLNASELRSKFFNLKRRYKETLTLNSLIAESFALTREAAKRTFCYSGSIR